MATSTNPASDKQLGFIAKLISEKQVPDDLLYELQLREDGMTTAEASNIITDLMACPRKQIDAPQSPGMYAQKGLGIFRVRASKTSGKLYAMELKLNPNPDSKRPGKFEYAAGAIYKLHESDRMSLEDVKAFGLETGICCVCGAFLTDPKSVEAGIGPICASKVGY